MNSPFVIEQAKAFANRADVAKLTKLEERVERMVRLAYGRAAGRRRAGGGEEVPVGAAGGE